MKNNKNVTRDFIDGLIKAWNTVIYITIIGVIVACIIIIIGWLLTH